MQTVDPRNLKPRDLSRLLRKAGADGISPRILERHKTIHGVGIGANSGIDLVRYTAMLLDCRARNLSPEELPVLSAVRPAGRTVRDRKVELMRSKRLIGRDIGPVPACVNPDRKEACRRDLEKFCMTYQPEAFYLPWSDDHLKVIRCLVQVILHGGLFALAMPRGEGKTALCRAACLWALLYGHRRYIFLVGATDPMARKLLAGIRQVLRFNPLILEDFPAAVFPVHGPAWNPKRCEGQMCCGQPTLLTWGMDKLIMPTIPASECSGSIIEVGGITGGKIRGPQHVLRDGTVLRPDLLLPDDPQTDKSAKSEEMSKDRAAILAAAVLGMAGPDVRIACMMPCTVIRKGDMADNILNREEHPEWHGERLKLVYAWPAREDLWEKYCELRHDGMAKAGPGMDGGEAATEFYRRQREEMDRGAVLAWKHRYNPEELSALQHAMNLRMHDEAAFYAEYQNEPKDLREAGVYELDALVIAKRINGLPRLTVPEPTVEITAFIDVGWKKLHYTVVAWDQRFSGSVLDYGEYPKGKAVIHDATNPARSLDVDISAALRIMIQRVADGHYAKASGALMRPALILVDCGDAETRPTVFRVCQGARFSAAVAASRGRAHTRFRIPKKAGIRSYPNSFRDFWTGLGTVYVHNACVWREWTQKAFLLPDGAAESYWIWGQKKTQHPILANHICSERLIEKMMGETGEYYKWQIRGGDNHLLDCLVGCAVGAGIRGLRIGGGGAPRRKRLSFSEAQQKKRRETRK